MMDIAGLLMASRRIAIVGLSDKPERDSYRVASYLQSQGYSIVPVNPHIRTVLGEMAYSRLEDIPEPVDIVDIFRAPDQVPAIVDSSVLIGAKAVWMQLGVAHDEAIRKALDAGLEVVSERCIMIEHKRLNIASRIKAQ
ncbi:MAG: CoA-binding protein [Proteobacteria bacterium]|nr:CoA-binding protein [Pseudomonadota bacterium]